MIHRHEPSGLRPHARGRAAAAAVVPFVLLLVASRARATDDPPRRPAAPPPALATATPVRGCADLAGVDLTGIGGAGSRVTRAGETTSDGVAVCSVEGTLAPAIGFRVDLPTRSWTRRYLQVGCGGLCGRVSLEVGAAEGCPVLAAGGFAVASTDMGHEGTGGGFGRDPQKRADFAHRAVHLTAVAARALIRSFYGREPAYAYFTGCSDGGREALVEAQRHPGDFDGIIAGAAAMNFQVQNGLYHAWQARSNTGPDGKAILLAGRLPVLHDAVLTACDALDGRADGLVSAPGACRFDPASVRCRAGQDSTACLTPEEVAVVRRLYDGPRDPATGERLTVGGPQFGSELAWAGVFVPHSADRPIMSERFALDALRTLIFETDPPAGFTLADLAFDRATFDRLRPRHPLFDATDPDLSAFAARGGKLILWHGWADPHISPLNTVAYHEAVRAQVGEARAEAFERLYLLPGVHHCSGGEGPSLIDLLTPMMLWVERGQAPDAIVARQAPPGRGNGFGQPGDAARGGDGPGAPPPGTTPPSGATPGGMAPPPGAGVRAEQPPAPSRSRPVYPYPFVAAYDGTGDPDRASSYRRGGPLAAVRTPDWAGSDFYRPYAARDR